MILTFFQKMINGYAMVSQDNSRPTRLVIEALGSKLLPKGIMESLKVIFSAAKKDRGALGTEVCAGNSVRVFLEQITYIATPSPPTGTSSYQTVRRTEPLELDILHTSWLLLCYEAPIFLWRGASWVQTPSGAWATSGHPFCVELCQWHPTE